MRAFRSDPSFFRLAAAVLLVALLCPPGSAAPADAPSVWRRPIGESHRVLATLTVAVEEISGLVVLPGGTAAETALLAVTDEGPYDRERGEVAGALYRVEVVHDPSGPSRVNRVVPVVLHARFERFDPGWPAPVSPFDLEGVARVPGHEDLFLLSGERNPEDQTDDGANRLYLVRYPAGGEDRAEMVRYLRVFDLEGDGMNDRFEGVALLPAEGGARLFAFKERDGRPGAVPAYVTGMLRAPAWTLEIDGDRGYPPLRGRRLAPTVDVVSSQSDALARDDGTVWVLDRWRREIHVARPRPADGALVLEGHLDLLEVLAEVPGEQGAGPPPPGRPERAGYGRHEGLAADGAGRLYLAADLGGGRPSTLTVLGPRRDAGR